MKKRLLFSSIAWLMAPQFVQAASVTIQWSTNRIIGDVFFDPLNPGTSSDGDGSLLELGYFTAGTPLSPFSGSWIVLATGSIGDQGVNAAGRFSITTVLTEGSFTQPLVGTPLAIRYYDGTSIAASTFYNTGVNTDGSGLWVSPSDPSSVIQLTLSKEGSQFEDQPGGFRTSIAIPEPGSALLALVSLGSLILRRRRIAGSGI